MIAKTCNRNGKRRADFRDIIAYISEQSKAVAIQFSPALASLETAGQEMTLVAQRNVRCNNPLYHYVLSWPSTDVVSHEQIFASVDYSLRKLGVTDEYQWVAAIHGDSRLPHAHVLVNRIHPETYLQLSIGFDLIRLSRVCRELELRFAWTRGTGLCVFDPVTGKIVGRGRRQSAIHGRAVDAEIWTGHTSFQRWLSGEPAAAVHDVLSDAKGTWNDIHTTLSRFGLMYELHGRGAIVVDRCGKRPLYAKATHLGPALSLPAMQGKLGPYIPSSINALADFDRTYRGQRSAGKLQTAHVKQPAISALFETYESEVERWRMQDAPRRRERWAECQRRAAQRAAEYHETRKSVREALKGPSVIRKNHLHAVARHLLAEKRQANVEATRAERSAINALYKAPPSLFRVWLHEQADAGDLDAANALAYLRNVTNQTQALSGSFGRNPQFDRTAARTLLDARLQNLRSTTTESGSSQDLWRKQLERELKRENHILRRSREDIARCGYAYENNERTVRIAHSIIAMDTVIGMLQLQQLFEFERAMFREMLDRVPMAFTNSGDIPDSLPPLLTVPILVHYIEKDGSVVYTLPNALPTLTDVGDRFDLENADGATIQLGLLLARQKWLEGIDLHGTDAFKEAALREAVALNITITNPELLQQQAILTKEREQQCATARYLSEEHKQEYLPGLSHDSEHKNTEVSKSSLCEAAKAAAEARGFTVDVLREHTECVEGMILSAWSFHNTGFVLTATTGDKTELIVTTSERAREAYHRLNERTTVSFEREGLRKSSQSLTRQLELEHSHER